MDFLSRVWTWLTDGDNWSGPAGIPTRVWEHVWVSGVSVVLACVVALPIGLWLGHLRRGGVVAVNIANVGRAVPSFALLVLGFQIWLFDESFGISRATLVALVALAVPPMLTNAYVAVSTVPDEVRDAAFGLGMRRRQVLWKVELPIALPLVLAGIRTSAVQVVATATLSALVAAGGLGRYIVDGIAVRDFPRVFSGALLVAVLALLVDLAFALLQRHMVSEGLRGGPASPRRTGALQGGVPSNNQLEGTLT